ncbi:VOC family protein [Kordiimonas sp.]|uniref:VOC family protein n=1 Tax=Kordiimonas sp. TaxID=1970157 RepID=UPI003A93DBB0
MKRLHVHMGVADLEAAITYYSAMFGAEPVKVRDDYAKWAPEDLAVNFAVSKSTACGNEGNGIGHLGIEVQSDEDITAVGERLSGVDAPVRLDGHVSCCYAKSNKAWSEDPFGIKWELFRTFDDSNALAPSHIKEPAA